jgi:hypothetical protein
MSKQGQITLDIQITGSSAVYTGVDLRTNFFEQLAPSKFHWSEKYRSDMKGGFTVQNLFSIIWAKSCNLRTSDPIFREKCCLEKSHF